MEPYQKNVLRSTTYVQYAWYMQISFQEFRMLQTFFLLPTPPHNFPLMFCLRIFPLPISAVLFLEDGGGATSTSKIKQSKIGAELRAQ